MNASLGFFEILLIIILSFYLLGLLSRILLPILTKAYLTRMSKRFGFQMPEQEQPNPGKPGKVSIKKEPSQESIRSGNLDNVGEYTEYEEIRE